MFYLLRRIFGSDRIGLWMALLYAFGTPVFFRTGFLNHNMILGHITFMAFLAMWNPAGSTRWAESTRYFLGGLGGGMALLLDYSGVVLLATLFCYGIAKAWERGPAQRVIRYAGVFIAGAVGPILLLWFYQWQSFGNPFLPGQHWMPPVEWIDVGYQGFALPQPELLRLLLVDYRYGLFATCPLLLIALLAPWYNRGPKKAIPTREFVLLMAVPLGLWLFCGGISYVRLQYNNGLRYLAPLLPYLFVAAAIVLARIPRRLAYFLSVAAVVQAWSMAMYRDVERGLGVLDPLVHIFIGGFQLPSLTVLARMSGQYGDYAALGVSPLPVFAVAAALICIIWSRGIRTPAGTETEAPRELTALSR
jgi:hypothetical protein